MERARDGTRHERGGGRSRSRSRSRDRRPRSRSRSRSRARGPAPALSRDEKELQDLTRDARTIFVSSLVVRATERDVKEFFEQVGRVERVSLIKDKVSGKSKGFGYVEFADLDSLPQALLLHGTKFCTRHVACMCSGFPVAVKLSEAEKNYAAQAEAVGGALHGSGAAEKRIYVCSLAPDVTEADLRLLCGQMGLVERVVLTRARSGDGAGHRVDASRGWGVVIFHDPSSAALALAQLHNLPVGGSAIKVGRMNEQGQVVALTGEVLPLSMSGGRGGGDEGGMSFQARAAIMSQLSTGINVAARQLSTGLAAVVQAAAVAQHAAIVAGGEVEAGGEGAGREAQVQEGAVAVSSIKADIIADSVSVVPPASAAEELPTPFICLSHLFDPASESDPGWAADIEAEVREEAGAFGSPVLFAHLDQFDSRGLVFLQYADAVAAQGALRGMRGRVFAGRTIGASFLSEAAFRVAVSVDK